MRSAHTTKYYPLVSHKDWCQCGSNVKTHVPISPVAYTAPIDSEIDDTNMFTEGV